MVNGAPKTSGGWYFSRAEIENNSPSRRDGIDLKKESELRQSYCSLIQDLGMRLGAPQLTIATAVIFCHRFYLYQSHAKNDWRTIATACLFHAAKVEDTPISLNKVVTAAYEMIYRKDPDAAQQIRQKDVLDKQKSLVILGERMLLANIGFDFNVQHPYRPLVRALNKFEILEKNVRQVAWNYVNDWLRTTLCLQYKPHYIAAGSLYIAAKIHNVKLPSGKDYAWWNEFDVTPKQLNAVVQEMTDILGYKRKSLPTCPTEKPAEISLAKKKGDSSSPESCVLSRPGSLTRNSSNDSDGQLEMINQNHPSSCNPDGKQVYVGAEIKAEVQARGPDASESVADSEKSRKGMEKANLEPIQVCDAVEIKSEVQARGPDASESVADSETSGKGMDKVNLGPDQVGVAAEMNTEVPARGSDASQSAADTDTSGKVMNKSNSGPVQVVNGLHTLNMDKILAMRKKRKIEKENEKRAAAIKSMGEDDWIERELEKGILSSSQSVGKKHKVA
ncbi:cyclin-T1-2-like isoform X2 [Dioscorea cayenensis subsp. rotundata]|uniref:Cyclin-T1-2-like isoform X2 n=1 Tax=Dioscorea cayennensis subsp. rotundata TaxID=55577 RepID=A0AB40CT43_DIOCR|nr:cyclin-T1-2-like isoform X2 [Dioscorea cayenensis subsp. rotundata]